MKASLILALPAMAIAAVTPPSVEQRQLPDFDVLPLDIDCLRNVANIGRCFPNLGSGSPPTVGDLLDCVESLPTLVGSILQLAALRCIDLSDLPTKA
ncbi:hypothetical protein FPOAC2_05664 [Fusarium poae]|uniref:Hydrophobin n=1 Tax=Fusarium poae TaxID=36050 RepID=A0A1B8AVC4_FUSPO|nr:hypothetical protein FPOAC1_005550 [Fusarium poae]KAG8672286.1 hypothetical protein FPOAC1_005550 [Fusarium poae]OBS24489.1 hypothetical protein FPOA_05030 [Fusarium poae]